jgi:hypothetical protein
MILVLFFLVFVYSHTSSFINYEKVREIEKIKFTNYSKLHVTYVGELHVTYVGELHYIPRPCFGHVFSRWFTC